MIQIRLKQFFSWILIKLQDHSIGPFKVFKGLNQIFVIDDWPSL